MRMLDVMLDIDPPCVLFKRIMKRKTILSIIVALIIAASTFGVGVEAADKYQWGDAADRCRG